MLVKTELVAANVPIALVDSEDFDPGLPGTDDINGQSICLLGVNPNVFSCTGSYSLAFKCCAYDKQFVGGVMGLLVLPVVANVDYMHVEQCGDHPKGIQVATEELTDGRLGIFKR
jgi:hypothetical protein